MSATTARFVRSPAAIRADLAAAEKRLDELRRDPGILDCGSDVEVEHRRTSLRLARLRSELPDSLVRPTRHGARY